MSKFTSIKIEPMDFMMLLIIATVMIALISVAIDTFSHRSLREHCASLPLSSYTEPDDNTPAKCYEIWKKGGLV